MLNAMYYLRAKTNDAKEFRQCECATLFCLFSIAMPHNIQLKCLPLLEQFLINFFCPQNGKRPSTSVDTDAQSDDTSVLVGRLKCSVLGPHSRARRFYCRSTGITNDAWQNQILCNWIGRFTLFVRLWQGAHCTVTRERQSLFLLSWHKVNWVNVIQYIYIHRMLSWLAMAGGGWCVIQWSCDAIMCSLSL